MDEIFDNWNEVKKKTHKNQNEITSSTMICQFRTFSKKRLLYKIGKINELEFKEILEKLKRIIDPTC